jgi:hypothetical protein
VASSARTSRAGRYCRRSCGLHRQKDGPISCPPGNPGRQGSVYRPVQEAKSAQGSAPTALVVLPGDKFRARCLLAGLLERSPTPMCSSHTVLLGKEYRPPQEVSSLAYIVFPGKPCRLRGEALSSRPGKNAVLRGKTYRPRREALSSSRGKVIVLPGKYATLSPAKPRFFAANKVSALYLFVLNVHCVSMENKGF